LLDPERYPADKIAERYRMRWQVEVDLRDLKITLGMDVLKGKKVETVLLTRQLLFEHC
jgi:IS4 transposase